MMICENWFLLWRTAARFRLRRASLTTTLVPLGHSSPRAIGSVSYRQWLTIPREITTCLILTPVCLRTHIFIARPPIPIPIVWLPRTRPPRRIPSPSPVPKSPSPSGGPQRQCPHDSYRCRKLNCTRGGTTGKRTWIRRGGFLLPRTNSPPNKWDI